jgi:adenylate cyclase
VTHGGIGSPLPPHALYDTSRDRALRDREAERQTASMGLRGIKVKTAVTLFAFGGAILAALPLHWVWWRTARDSSLQLVDVLSEQITSTVRRELWERVVASESAYGVAASLLGPAPDADAARRALEAALSATQVPSALTFASAVTGQILASRGASGQIEMRPMPSPPALAGTNPPQWREVPANPANGQPGVAYSGLAGADGVLSVYIGMDRFATFLGAIPVGRTGGAFVVDPRGAVRVRPDPGAAESLAPVLQAAAAIVAARPVTAVNIVEARRIAVGDASYRVSFSPLEFNGWQFVVIVPEAEFLGDIEKTMRRALISLVGLAIALGILAALLAQRVLSRPLSALTADLQKVERFELEEVTYRRGRLQEFDQLSAAIARMANGLADFAKFIPTDLVRMLLADGVRAAPGGETRELTVMFADVAGFTKISERMGTGVIDVISRYLDVVSRTVETQGGTVDKFIGDAVMALWGAPRGDPDQAAHACLAALAAIDAVRLSGIVDDQGNPLRVRIGLHSGPAVVGNIGSERRLNYTAIGDTVNLASRLEGANKVFGTSILISEATRAAAGDAFATRELGEVSVLGKAEAIRVHELIAAGGAAAKPPWAYAYEEALRLYRDRDFKDAVRGLDGVLQVRPEDGPARWLKAACLGLLAAPPPASWKGVAVLDAK